MTNTKEKVRKGRSSAEGKTKKIVSLTIEPAIIDQLDAYASDNGLSRSEAVGRIILEVINRKTETPATPIIKPAINHSERDQTHLYAAPQMGAAYKVR